MRKYYSYALIALLAAAMILTSCSRSEFGVTDNNEKLMVLNAVNAAADEFVLSGTLEIGDGEELIVDSALESGSVQLEFISNEGMDDVEEVPELSGEAALTVQAAAGEKQTYQIGPGAYMVKSTVTEKATGTITISVEQAEVGDWIEASSAEEAGELAGVGLFLADPQGTSLGPVINADYHYMDGVAEAHYGIAAVDVYIRKGLADINEGDVSFDANDYAYEWTHDHNGTEVKCFGNREGEATKSVWQAGDCNYAVLAYGAGGDDDFGLSAEDLDIVLNDIQ